MFKWIGLGIGVTFPYLLAIATDSWDVNQFPLLTLSFFGGLIGAAGGWFLDNAMESI